MLKKFGAYYVKIALYISIACTMSLMACMPTNAPSANRMPLLLSCAGPRAANSIEIRGNATFLVYNPELDSSKCRAIL